MRVVQGHGQGEPLAGEFEVGLLVTLTLVDERKHV